ncbi:MAG: RNA polymerase sigma factor [Chloroflexi bacterium]|nr:RNA polymerase sigma factor [Chloroflexota bacterium]MYK61048.1 RNA polymerase sigma factor [Chloroflexota bacterium]
MQVDENLLLTMAMGGDVDAFNRLVAIHQNAVYGFAMSLTRQHALADDVTQETFISAFHSISKMRGGNFRAWLLRIARNKAYDHFRRQNRRRESSVDEEDAPFLATLSDDNPSPHAVAVNSELREALEHCVGGLSDEHREVIVLIDVQGESYDDASAVCGVNIGTVKSRLNRARRRVRDCLRGFPGLLPSGMAGQTL